MAGSDIFGALVQSRVRHSGPQVHEDLPGVHRHATLGSQDLVSGLVPHDDALEIVQRGGHEGVLLELLVVLQNDDLGPTVLGDVVTSVGRVSTVDTSSNAAREDSTSVGNEPLRLLNMLLGTFQNRRNEEEHTELNPRMFTILKLATFR